MTSRIEERQLWVDESFQQLTLVYSANRLPGQLFKLLLKEAIESTNRKVVTQVTYALMSRLRIPHNSTIIGLLGVGLSRSNFEEMSKWVAQQLPTVTSGTVQGSFEVLERRFRQSVGQFPED